MCFIAELMRRCRLRAKREAEDVALRRTTGSTATTDGLLSLEGIGWDGDLDSMRSDPPTP